MADPVVGRVYDGYLYLGGNPNDQASWRPVSGGGTYANGRQRGLSTKEQADLSEAREAARNALSVLPDLERFGRINATQDTGGWRAIPQVDRVLGAFDADVSQLNEISARLTPQQREPGSGTTSDRDLALFIQAVPNVQRPRAANEAIIERGRAEGRRRVAYADFLDRYAAENGTLNGADQAFRAAVESGEIDLSAPAEPSPVDQGVSRGGVTDPYANRSDYRIPEGDPGYSADNPIDLSTADPASLHTTLANGGYVRYPDGRIEHVRSMGPAIPGAEQVAPGITRTTPEQTTPETDLGSVIERNVGAFAQGAAEQIPFLDEAAAGAFGALSGLGYETARARQQTLSQQDRESRGLARNIGGLTGFGATAAVPLGGVGNVGRAANLAQRVRNVGRLAGEGAAVGALYGAGAGEGGYGQRLGNALEGAVVGAVAAPAANALARPVIGAVQGAFRRGEPLTNALGRFGRRYEPDTNALAQRVDDLNAMGIEPAFVDVMDEGQRGLTRALATRQTPARQAVREFGEGRAEGLQDRLRYQARRTVSDDPRSPMEIREAAVRTAREQAAPLYEQAFATPIEITPELSSLLNTPAGRSALQRAQTIAANERRAINLDQPDMQTLDYVKRGLDDLLEENRDPVTGRLNLTDQLKAVQDVRQAFRGEIDRLNPIYAQARQAYGDSASFQGATELGEDFLTMEADQFARQASRLRPGERAVAQAGARRAIERQAGTQGRAPGVARTLSTGREQMIRNAALLDNPVALQNAARAELEGVKAAEAINPARGSVTTPSGADLQEAAKSALMGGGLRALVGGVVRKLARVGYSDREAEALVTASIDPNRTREVIDMLAQRMSRSEARNLVRTARYMASQSGGRSAGDYQ